MKGRGRVFLEEGLTPLLNTPYKIPLNPPFSKGETYKENVHIIASPFGKGR